jgi:hypothetical protein
MNRQVQKIIIATLGVIATIFVGISPTFAANTPTLILSGGSGVFGLDPAIIVATASVAGNVAFTANGAQIVGCESVATATLTPFIARCSWVPSVAGATTLGAVLTPTDLIANESTTAPAFAVKVGTPVQGVTTSPISLYVDTIIASGSTGALAPRFGVSCAITSQFIVGQTIVFRVYGNDSDLGGAVLDSSNVASAYVTVAGIANPIPLTYGNHSGVAFWAAALKTGTTTGLYGTLGVVNFKVTVITKDQNSIKVLSTKLQARILNGQHVKDSSGATVYDRVSYYRNVPVNPPLKGAMGVWQSNFTPSSQVTLYAIPTN